MTNNEMLTDLDYFKSLNIDKQKEYNKKLKEIVGGRSDMPYIFKLLDSPVPIEYKQYVMQKIKTWTIMETSNNEYSKLHNWIDSFFQIPFGIYKELPQTNKKEFLNFAKNTLNSVIYGMDETKEQLLQLVAKIIVNPACFGSTIGIYGPPGTGKTSIVKEGLCRIFDRHCGFISLGGNTDANHFYGYNYTYEGSKYGQIVQTLIHAKCMNPVFYFDELDKVSETARGQEIYGMLTHLVDTSQNDGFQDKYYNDFKLDISKSLFIFSYNDESKVPPILLNRMYKIETKAYTVKDKIAIARDYMWAKICNEYCFQPPLLLPDDVTAYIVENFTEGEPGVRNMKRSLETLASNLNINRLLNDNYDIQIITKDVVKKYLVKPQKNSAQLQMYI